MYDGLFSVESYWRERGPSGFILWKFRLVKLSAAHTGTAEQPKESFMSTVSDSPTTIVRCLQETEAGRQVKALYHYRCQICGVRLVTPIGPYAEAAHIRPLTAPHYGPDTAENVLCLCPNHHALLTFGGIAIADDLTLIGQEGRLTIDFRHHINKEHLRYHRKRCWIDPENT
jgi:putative restriction endonuclease